MRIGIKSNHPHIVTLGLAHILKNYGSVNIISNGLYGNGLLFLEEDDKEQERDGIFFNSSVACEYELVVNEDTSCDMYLFHLLPSYRELKPYPEEFSQTKNIILIENPPVDVGLRKKFILSKAGLPENDNTIVFTPEEKDIVCDYRFGIQLTFSLDKLSKTYQRILLEVFNLIHGTSFSKIKQIKNEAKKKAIRETSSTSSNTPTKEDLS